MESIMEPSSAPPKGTRDRPRKYHTDEERKAAKVESRRRKLQEMKETDPDRYKQLMRQKNQREADRFRASRQLVDEADAEGGARLQDPEVVAARAYVEHIRAQRRAHFNDYYRANEEFRIRHRAKVAAYDRAKAAQNRAAANATSNA
jgi:hypothetical protein